MLDFGGFVRGLGFVVVVSGGIEGGWSFGDGSGGLSFGSGKNENFFLLFYGCECECMDCFVVCLILVIIGFDLFLL